MPKTTTTESLTSPPATSSCNKIKLQDEQDNDNAKCLGKSLLPTITTQPTCLAATSHVFTISTSASASDKSDSNTNKYSVDLAKMDSVAKVDDSQSILCNESVLLSTANKKENKASRDTNHSKHLEDLIIKDDSYTLPHVDACKIPKKLTTEQLCPRTLLEGSSAFCAMNSSNPSEIELLPILSTTEGLKSIPSSSKSPCDPTSRNIVPQISFSDVQDKYFHSMITRIATNTDEFSVPDTPPTISSDLGRQICVTTIPQIIKGADCTLTTNNSMPFIQPTTCACSPTIMSAWSSASSVATRTNTDNHSSMSLIVTNFSASKKKSSKEYTGDDGTTSALRIPRNPTAVTRDDINTEDNTVVSMEMHQNIAASSRNTSKSSKNKVKTFKSTAV